MPLFVQKIKFFKEEWTIHSSLIFILIFPKKIARSQTSHAPYKEQPYITEDCTITTISNQNKYIKYKYNLN